MSRIVKSIAVVDDRSNQKKTSAQTIEAGMGNKPVIKKQSFSYHENPYADQKLFIPNKQGYIDELNRVKVEIAQAKAELRSLGRQVDEAVEERDNQVPELAEDGNRGAVIAQAEAERLLRETRTNIEAMMENARAEGQKLAEEAANNGYLDGFEKGFAQATSEFKAENDPKIKQLEELLEKVSVYYEEMVAQNENELLELTMTAAKKIVGHEIKSDSRTIVTMLYQLLDQNRREESIRITVSPELMPAEAKAGAEVKKLIADIAPCAMIYVDEDAGEGTCIVETGKGITDLSVSTQISNMKDILSGK